jgi:murein DD-endopeptidase MepM/ murein hydrolase activator NlpD
MKKATPILIALVVVLAAAANIFLYGLNDKILREFFVRQITNNNIVTAPANETITPTPPANLAIAEPIANALNRIKKKSFGIYVSPVFSPVNPERFTGYHTGVDFETTSNEKEVDIPIYAICPGKLLLKKTASGYGGVINELCAIEGQAVTVTYGHLRLSSIVKKVGETFSQGEQIGVLGKGNSVETDGERKHLHLGIHKGAAAVMTGYVADFSELEQWVNVVYYLKPKT